MRSIKLLLIVILTLVFVLIYRDTPQAQFLLETIIFKQKNDPQVSEKIKKEEIESFSIAFGCCVIDGKEKIWEAIEKKSPNMFLLLGGTFQSSKETWGNTTRTQMEFEKIYKQPGPASLLLHVPTYAIWNDVDYGPMFSDSTFEHKRMSVKAFRKQWIDNPKPPNEKLSESVAFSLDEKIVEILMTDNRTYRVPVSVDNLNPTLFGREQRGWIVERIRNTEKPFLVIASGGQLLKPNSLLDQLQRFEKDEKEIFEAISKSPAQVVFISGERRQGEILKRTIGKKEVYEVTASPMSGENMRLHSKNRASLGVYTQGVNFGLVTFIVGEREKKILFEVCDETGIPVIKQVQFVK